MMHPIRTYDDIGQGLVALSTLDPRLVDVMEATDHVPLRIREPSLGNLMKIIISQQLSVQSADAIWQRFEAAFDPSDPRQIETASDEALKAVGLSRPKIKTLRAVASETLHHDFEPVQLVGQSLEAVHGRMTSIHGIGPWTADIFALFCLGHPDVFPVGDIALQHAVRQAFQLEARPTGDALHQIAEQWSPWRGVAARLFWAYYGDMKKRATLPV